MLKFYIPYYYLIHSRLKSKIDLLSWFIIFIIPQFILSYIFTNYNLFVFILLFFIAQTIFNTLYEIGYLENDIYTTQRESTPTLRLGENEYKYISKNYIKIILFKYFIVFIGIALLCILNKSLNNKLCINNFIILLFINRVFFYLHNTIRNKFNLFTFSVLSITKYIFPIVLFLDKNTLFLSFVAILLFPLLRIIEHSTHKRYLFIKYAKIIGNHDKFRIYYYGLFLIIFIFSTFLYQNKNFLIITILFSYFFIYRVVSFVIIKKGFYKRDELKNKDLYIK